LEGEGLTLKEDTKVAKQGFQISVPDIATLPKVTSSSQIR